MHIKHFLIPHQKNNHRAKLLHNASLFTLIIIISFVSSLSLYVHKTHPEVLGISYQISNSELLNLTNYERGQAGLKSLTLNSSLSEAASQKADYILLWSRVAVHVTISVWINESINKLINKWIIITINKQIIILIISYI